MPVLRRYLHWKSVARLAIYAPFRAIAIYVAERVKTRSHPPAVRADGGSRIVALPRRRKARPGDAMPGGAIILPFAPRTRPIAVTEPPALTGSR